MNLLNMPEPAGLYARAGRSLCQSRPVSMPERAGRSDLLSERSTSSASTFRVLSVYIYI